MKEPYQIVLDLWEGNPDIDPPVLLQNGVAGLIVRLNDMSGGHHMDAQFEANWTKAKLFPAQSLYFVYNPWKNGLENYNWLMDHLPGDFGRRRLFVDVEVRYAGYPAKTYAEEVAKFKALASAHFTNTKYSGGGFLTLLDPWPTDEEYWWAAYSTALTACTTWEAYKQVLAVLDYAWFTRLCPGEARMLQASADGSHLPGFGVHAVDANIFPGTLDELRAWFGCETQESEDTMDWSKNAIGLYTDNTSWTNPAFHFIIGKANTPAGEPNPNLKPIETKARGQGAPFIALWDFDQAAIDFYVQEKKLGVNSPWPPLDQDWPYLKLVEALQGRNPDALMIRVMCRESKAQQEPGNIVWFAARQFFERANYWFYKNKGNWKWSILVSSNDFIVSSGAGDYANNWAGNWPSCIEQEALRPLSGAYPQGDDKPRAYLGTRPKWEFWYYYNSTLSDLVLYNGSPAELKTFLGMDTPAPVDTTPPTTPGSLEALVAGSSVTLAWEPSTDNVGVTGYALWRDGVSLGTVNRTDFTEAGLAPGAHLYEVAAFDAAGNHSARAIRTVVIGAPVSEVSRAEFEAALARIAELERWRKS